MNIINKLKKKLFKDENSKIIFSNILGALIVKGVAFFVSFLAVPAYMDYFENQVVLGLWFTMLSMLSWVLTFDLGIGNGLRNHLVPAFNSNDKINIKRYISSGYFMFGILTVIISLIVLILFRFIDFNLVFNISKEIISNEILRQAVNIIFIGILLSFFLKLINSILFAMQMSSINNFISLITNILILLYLKTASTTEVSLDLIRLAIAYTFANNGPLIIATILVFSTRLKESKPNLKYFNKNAAKNILSLGTAFFGVQIMYMLLTTTNEYMITWLVQPEKVVEYQVYYRIFTFMSTLFALALTPIWSAVTKAISEGNKLWVEKLYKTLKNLSLLGAIAHFLLIPFLQMFVNIWLGEEAIVINYSYALMFAVFGSIYIWNAVLSTLANGMGNLRIQMICYSIGAILKIPISWVLVLYLDSWIGVVIANIIAMGIYSVVQPIYLKINK